MSCGISLSVKALKALKAQPQETGAIYELVATVTAPSLGQHVGDAAFQSPNETRRYLYNTYIYFKPNLFNVVKTIIKHPPKSP